MSPAVAIMQVKDTNLKEPLRQMRYFEYEWFQSLVNAKFTVCKEIEAKEIITSYIWSEE